MNPPKDNLRLAMLLQNSGVRPEVSRALSETFEARSANEREFWIRSLAEVSQQLATLRARLVMWQLINAGLLALIAVLIFFHH